MKYFVTVQASQADYDAMSGSAGSGSPRWSPEDIRAMLAFMNELNAELADSGELLDGQGFTAPAEARFVTGSPGRSAVVTDRPYAEDDVQPAGYWLLECSGLDRVTEIAARITQCPAPEGSPERPVVIRPVGEAPTP
ncbi:YciI family protein [Streptomyces sp. NPDC012888]|uniref:YciI family protein n=1 Tax=Streptomyces sp. NPDC012888 TaxID=3364855 RepID=UPI00367F17E6